MSSNPFPAGAEVSWSDIADWYDALLTSRRSPHGLAVATTLALAGDVAGLRVLDVGCGQGAATRALAAAGAEVTGADLTPELVAAARRHEAEKPLGIRYLESDAQRLAELPNAAFDLVTCQLALMDIPDLDATLIAVHRVLRPGGSFVAVLSHPCFLAPFASTVDGPDGQPGRLVARYLDEEFWRSPNPEGVRRRRVPPDAVDIPQRLRPPRLQAGAVAGAGRRRRLRLGAAGARPDPDLLRRAAAPRRQARTPSGRASLRTTNTKPSSPR